MDSLHEIVGDGCRRLINFASHLRSIRESLLGVASQSDLEFLSGVESQAWQALARVPLPPMDNVALSDIRQIEGAMQEICQDIPKIAALMDFYFFSGIFNFQRQRGYNPRRNEDGVYNPELVMP